MLNHHQNDSEPSQNLSKMPFGIVWLRKKRKDLQMVIQSLLKCHKNVEMIIIENNYFLRDNGAFTL